MNESEFGWTFQGKVNFILDNLIAEGKAEPMIVIMENGMNIDYSNLLLNNLMPEVESKFRCLTSIEKKAVAGLSMGAGQAEETVLRNPEKFGYLGMFSGAGKPDMNLLDNLSQKMSVSGFPLIWIGCGLGDQYLSYVVNFHNLLVDKNIFHTYYTMKGNHEWQVWRKCLYEFAQICFKKK
jgi:enterochelin esterase family protein